MIYYEATNVMYGKFFNEIKVSFLASITSSILAPANGHLKFVRFTMNQ